MELVMEGMMAPFKSQAQRRKFGEMLKDKKISQDEFDKWNSETPTKNLPERIGKKPVRSIDDIKKVKIK